jgi:hypothetical protein
MLESEQRLNNVEMKRRGARMGKRGRLNRFLGFALLAVWVGLEAPAAAAPPAPGWLPNQPILAGNQLIGGGVGNSPRFTYND